MLRFFTDSLHYHHVKAGFLALLTAFVLLSSERALADDTPVSETPGQVIAIPEAILLGVVEGVTEFLPVSSTGHLVLVDEMLGLRSNDDLSPSQLEAVEAYEIVIQVGAILAVFFLYGRELYQMAEGALGRSPKGRRLLINLLGAFIPTAVIGLAIKDVIEEYLQSSWPVIASLAVGGVAMIAFERSAFGQRVRQNQGDMTSMTLGQAVLIGVIQCLALWPGTSRSMVTIMGAMALGLSAVAAAEFSFLLGLVTLSAASGYKLIKHGPVLFAHIGWPSMLVGILVSAVVAAIAIKAFVAFLNRRGLEPFGWYRIALAAVMFFVLAGPAL